MSLLFNMLSRLVITFLPRNKRLLISWLQSPSAVILEPKNIKSATVSPSICHEVMGPDAMIFVFWMLSFKPTFSLSSFTFIKRLFSSFSLSAIRVVSSAYLRLLIFLLVILITACASSSPAFLMMYSAYKLNKQVPIKPRLSWDTILSLANLLCKRPNSTLFSFESCIISVAATQFCCCIMKAATDSKQTNEHVFVLMLSHSVVSDSLWL